MALGPTAQLALIDWLNSFPLEYTVRSAADLNDGLVLSKVLADIDHTYIPERFSRGDTLRDLVKALLRYIRTQCEDLDPLLDSPFLNTIVEYGHSSSILEVFEHFGQDEVAPIDMLFQIAVVILMAAISGPDREKYVVTITKLDAGVQTEIASIIQKASKQKEIENASASAADAQDPGAPAGEDFELDFEVRYGSLIAQKKDLEQERDRLKKQLADITTRLERLQDNNDLLQERLTAAEDGLHGVAREDDTAKVIKGLEGKVREQDELILNQEGQLELDRNEKDGLRREIESLAKERRLISDLKDEIKELQHQNLDLTKKANAIDRYKQKLESQRDFQEDARRLLAENEELRLQFRDNELLKHRNENLEATHIQFQNTLANRETEIFELSSQKKTLDEEKADLQRAVMRLEELKSTYEDKIAELSDRVHDRGQTPSPTAGHPTGSLEDELGDTHQGTRHDLELSRLRAENQLLKANVPVAREAAAIRSKLEELEKSHNRDEIKYNELFEKHVVCSQQLTAILTSSTPEGLVTIVNPASAVGQLKTLTPEYYSSEAFSGLRKTHLTTLEKASDLERKNHELEAALESTKRDLLTANTDLSMIAKEEKEALQDLKSGQEALSFSIGEELKTVQSRYKNLQDDHEQQKSLLIEALVSKDKLQQAVADLTARLSSATAVANAKGPDLDITDAKKQIERQENLIKELQARIIELEAGGNDTKTAALEKEIRGIQREYDLMTTAWYDLTSRLQSNNVVLQRREHVPKSWIKGQRSSLNPFGKRLP